MRKENGVRVDLGGAGVPCSLFFDNKVEYLECGKKFRKGENG